MSYVQRLWNQTDLNSPTTRFDNCGFKVGSSSPPAFQNMSNNKPYLIPSEAFPNLHTFLVDIGVPFYEDYDFTIMDDSNVTDPTTINCFACSNFINYSIVAVIFLFSILI